MTWQNFFFKTTRDVLIALLIAYFFLLVPEIVLPGIVSSHFSPKYFLVFILAVAWLQISLGKKNPAPRENIHFRAISASLLNIILVVAAAMLVLSLYKMKIWEIAVVASFSVGLLSVAKYVFVEDEGG
jgi:hypothetical protein